MDDWLPSERSGRPTDRTRAIDIDTPTGAPRASRARPRSATATATRPAPRMAPPQYSRRVVRRDIMLRRVDPWTVLKLSIVFYACILLVAMLGLAVFWAVVNRLGVIEQFMEFATTLNIEVTINAGNVMRAFFLLGLLNVVFWSGVNVFLAFLYNLVADLIGGVRVDLAEDE